MAHKSSLHGGRQLTLAFTRKRFWILNGLKAIKQHIHRCITCHRYNAKPAEQLMGDLPKPRLTVTRPFTNSGVDYAGPFDIKIAKGRGSRSSKAYVAVFICLATKAVHIEVVSDLTAQAFIAAFKRFVGRRGNVAHLYSDNGSNFILANKILRHNNKQALEYNRELLELIGGHGTQWHFIPPFSPHFGGLWEAGVKSIKFHLKRILGNALLTFEELNTVLIQIEACLNSRPLCPLTENPDDLEVLTPGHFLIGDSMVSPPEQDFMAQNINRLTRWQLISKLHQQFWRKWSSEYLSRLQQRPKWSIRKNNIKIGDLVLIKDEHLPPSRWLLGRISETHPGKDGLTRVISVHTKGKIFKRPITKVCPLPLTDNDDPKDTIGIVKEKIISANYIEVQTQRKEEKTDASHLTSCSHSNKRSFKPSFNLWNLFSYILLLGALLVSSKCQEVNDPVEIIPFESQTGLYLEQVGELNTVNNDWNIIVYYDLSNYWKELKGFRRCVREIRTFCNNNVSEVDGNYCQVILSQFQHQLLLVEHNNDLLYQQTDYRNSTRRDKRSPFDFVGNIAHGLFGVLDEKFAKQYEEQVENFKVNEDHLLELIKNQTSIADSTSNIIRKDEIAIATQFEEFKKHLEAITEESNHTDFKLRKQAVKQALLALAIHTILMMIGYQNTQNALLEVVMNTQHSKIHPLLLTPDQLEAQLNIIRSNLPASVAIPGDDNSQNLLQIYNLMSVKARVTKSFILFSLKIPLPNTEIFQLFRLVPVPMPFEGQFIFVQPSSEYLSVNLHRDRYYPLDETEIRSCARVKDSKYICKQRYPIYNTRSNVSKCELDLLNHENNLSPFCQLAKIATPNIWIQLHTPNNWIFALSEDRTVDIICNSKLFNKHLKGVGILRLKSN